MTTAIEWTEQTWNPVTGCTKVSPGCANCYIARTPPFRAKGVDFIRGNIPVTLHPDRLEIPLRRRKPTTYFVCSMGDLFHEDVPDDFMLQVWRTMNLSREHTYQVLTKRPARMRAWLSGLSFFANGIWPLPNVHLGVSCENQKTMEERWAHLRVTPAAKRFLSCEPLLGPLDFQGEWWEDLGEFVWPDWVIVGGESGPGSAERKLVERCRHLRSGETYVGRCFGCGDTGWRAKPEALEWVRSLRDQCQAAGVPFFFKQWGGPTPKAGGRMLDGREWSEKPQRQEGPA